MSPAALRILLVLIIAAHGIGHVLFLVPALGIADWGQSTRSWLLTAALGESPTRLLASLLWIIATLAFIAAAVGLFGQQEWWRPLAVLAAVVSTIGLILFWVAPVTQPVAAALVVNLVVIGALLIFHWPPASLINT